MEARRQGGREQRQALLRVVASIGEGSYSHCYLAVQATGDAAAAGGTAGERLVALKVYRSPHDAIMRRLARREARVHATVTGRHPNIVRLYDAYQSASGRLTLVMEYCQRCLHTELRRHPGGMPGPLVKVLAWQLVHGLAFLHSNNVIHRDVKPANVLLTNQGVVRVCDFSCSRFLSPSAAPTPLTSRSNTAEPQRQPSGPGMEGPDGMPAAGAAAGAGGGVVVGGNVPGAGGDDVSSYQISRWYRPPEVLLGLPYDTAADVWSLGCTIAELALGHPLLPGESSVDQLARQIVLLGPLPTHMTAPSDESPGSSTFTPTNSSSPSATSSPPPPGYTDSLAASAHRMGPTLRQRLAHLQDPHLLQLLHACLQLDPRRRARAAELLALPYFADVRRLVVGTALAQLYTPAHVELYCRPPGVQGLPAAPGPGNAPAAGAGPRRLLRQPQCDGTEPTGAQASRPPPRRATSASATITRDAGPRAHGVIQGLGPAAMMAAPQRSASDAPLEPTHRSGQHSGPVPPAVQTTSGPQAKAGHVSPGVFAGGPAAHLLPAAYGPSGPSSQGAPAAPDPQTSTGSHSHESCGNAIRRSSTDAPSGSHSGIVPGWNSDPLAAFPLLPGGSGPVPLVGGSAASTPPAAGVTTLTMSGHGIAAMRAHTGPLPGPASTSSSLDGHAAFQRQGISAPELEQQQQQLSSSFTQLQMQQQGSRSYKVFSQQGSEVGAAATAAWPLPSLQECSEQQERGGRLSQDASAAGSSSRATGSSTGTRGGAWSRGAGRAGSRRSEEVEAPVDHLPSQLPELDMHSRSGDGSSSGGGGGSSGGRRSGGGAGGARSGVGSGGARAVGVQPGLYGNYRSRDASGRVVASAGGAADQGRSPGLSIMAKLGCCFAPSRDMEA